MYNFYIIKFPRVIFFWKPATWFYQLRIPPMC